MFKTKIEELEYLFKNFPDVPKEVVVKEDLLRLGIRYTGEAIKFATESSTGADRGVIFSIARVKYDELGVDEAVNAPLVISLQGGMYKLRRLVAENRLNPKTPYLIDIVDGQPTLLADGTPIGQIGFPPVPEYYSKKFDDGTWYHDIVSMHGWHLYAFNVALRFCQLWGKNVECKFCDINKHARQKLADGVPFRKDESTKPVDKVGEVVKEIFFRQKQQEGFRVLGLFLTGGTIMGKVDGKDENTFYLEHVEAMRSVGNRWPLVFQSQAKTKEELKRFYDAGVTVHCANIEVWDDQLFKWICPGKEMNVGRDEWIRRVIDSVDIFGEGNVTPNFVSGVEMAQPYGFKDVNAALKSTVSGLEYLMSHGVTPKFDVWNVSPLSALAGNSPAPLEYYVRLNQAYCEIWQKYDLPVPYGMGPMGPGRARNLVSAHIDLDPAVRVPD